MDIHLRKFSNKYPNMATITDFNSWLSCIDLTDYNDVYSLYRTVTDLDEYGSFVIRKTVRGNDSAYFLKSSECDDTLMLASEKAKETFLYHLEQKFCGDMDMEGWYDFKRAMDKDD